MAGKKGVPFYPGGKREGSGRKPDWFVRRCKELFEKHKLLDFVAGVATGEEKEGKVSVTDEGPVVVDVSASIKDRLRATEMLKEWGYGKEITPIESAGGIGYLILNSQESEDA